MHLYLFFLFLKEQYLRIAEIKYKTSGYINPIEKLYTESLINII